MISKKIDSADLINILENDLRDLQVEQQSLAASPGFKNQARWFIWLTEVVEFDGSVLKASWLIFKLLFFRLFTDQWVFRLIPDLTPLLSVYMAFIILWQGESFRRQITFRERYVCSYFGYISQWSGEMYGVLVGCVEMDPSPFPSIIILSLSHAFDNSIRQPSTCKVAGLIWLPFLLDPGHINQTNGDGWSDVTTRHSLVALETLFRGPRGCQR